MTLLGKAFGASDEQSYAYYWYAFLQNFNSRLKNWANHNRNQYNFIYAENESARGVEIVRSNRALEKLYGTRSLALT